jgi:hypothetical protein
MLHRFVNGAKVWHLLVSHAVMLPVGISFLYSFILGVALLLACLVIGLTLAIKSGY